MMYYNRTKPNTSMYIYNIYVYITILYDIIRMYIHYTILHWCLITILMTGLPTQLRETAKDCLMF